MSALLPKADIAERDRHVRFVPKADIPRYGRDWRYSITSSARCRNDSAMVKPLLHRNIGRLGTAQQLDNLPGQNTPVDLILVPEFRLLCLKVWPYPQGCDPNGKTGLVIGLDGNTAHRGDAGRRHESTG